MPVLYYKKMCYLPKFNVILYSCDFCTTSSQLCLSTSPASLLNAEPGLKNKHNIKHLSLLVFELKPQQTKFISWPLFVYNLFFIADVA